MPHRSPFPSALLLGMLVGAAPLASEPVGEEEAPAPTPHVELEKLLRLPDSLDYRVERRGSATRGEWRERFRAAQADLEGAQAALSRAQLELEGVAQGSEAWQLAPPGATEAAGAPLSHRLRQEIRRQRAEVQRARQRLQELAVEADLAGVPADWRE